MRTKVLDLRLEGYTYREIADEVGVSRQRIHQLLCPVPGVRRFILDKYRRRCARCGVHVGRGSHFHSPNDRFDDINTIELLCLGCHREAHNIKEVTNDTTGNP